MAQQSTTATDTSTDPKRTARDAHLVTTSCTECGAAIEVPEERAEAARHGRPVTCAACEHDCLQHFGEGRNDPATPGHIVHYECGGCGQFWTFNTRTGEHELDD